MSEIIENPVDRVTIAELSLDQLDEMLTKLRERRTTIRVRVDALANDVPTETPQVKRERYAKLVAKINDRLQKIDESIDKVTEEVNKLRIMNMEIA